MLIHYYLKLQDTLIWTTDLCTNYLNSIIMHQYHYLMQFQIIADKITDLNLSIDNNTLQTIASFIHTQVGYIQELSSEEKSYTIYAASAIVLEEQKIPTVDGKAWVSSGITIEMLMAKLEGLNSQTFLNYLEKLILKHKDATPELIHKVEQLRISYRLFCKFQKLVQKLLEKMPGKTDEEVRDLISVIWQMYLLVKHSESELDIQQQTKTLIGCLLYVLGRLQISAQNIDYEIIQTQFSCQNCCIEKNIIDCLDSVIESLIIQRYHQSSFRSAFDNDNKRQRLLDDIRIKYEQNKNTHLPVDEIKYLKLPKNMTPFRMTVSTPVVVKYNKRINFDNMTLQGEIEDNKKLQAPINFQKFGNMQLLSPLVNRIKVGNFHNQMMSPYPVKPELTPLTSKTKDVKWINIKINEMDQLKKNRVLKLFNEVSNSAYYQTQVFCFDLLEQVLNKCNSKQSMIQIRKQKIYFLFQHMILKLSNDTQNTTDNYLLFGNFNFLKTILCITTQIFLYSNSLSLGQFRDVCSKFGCNYIDILYQISKTSKCDESMPQTLIHHLKMLENTILLRYVWEDRTGFKILEKSRNQINLSGEAHFVDKLNQAIHWRISQMTKNFKSFLIPIKELIQYVLTNKLFLVQNNFIDQIILCSMYHIVSQNPEQSNLDFEEIFRIYSRLQNSFQQYKNKAIYQNYAYSLLEFYQKVFSPSITGFETSKIIHPEMQSPASLQRIVSFGSPEHMLTEGKPNNWKKNLTSMIKNNSKKRRQQDVQSSFKLDFEAKNNTQQSVSNFNINVIGPSFGVHQMSPFSVNEMSNSNGPRLIRQFSFSKQDAGESSMTFGFSKGEK